MLQKTTAQTKIAKLRKRYRVVQGGTSSSKTYTIIPLLIDYAIKNPRKEISMVAESHPHLRRGVVKDFIKIMTDIGLYDDSQFNKGSWKYVFTNDSYIEFFSADKESKLRGARRDVLFVNEANNISWESFYQLAIRTSSFIYIDYNPVAEFWAHHELIGQPNTDHLILTYKDNEALEPNIVKELEQAIERAKTSDYWKNWVNVYVYGQVGQLQGTVFSDYKMIDNIPIEAKYYGIGLDFGYSNDPSAGIGMWEWNGKIIFDEVLYQKELTNREISKLIEGYMEKHKITRRHENVVADSSEPKSIADIKSYGVDIERCEKGADSVNYGIGLIHEGGTFYVTNRSINLIKELRNYIWKTDRSGATTNKPIDLWNHGCDAMRYIYTQKYSNKFSGKYSVSTI